MWNETNQGFARCCNIGALNAFGRYLIFLNNDTEVQPGWFIPLFNTLEDRPDIGIVGPKLVFPNDTIQHCGKIWKDIYGPLSQPHHIYYGAPCNAPFVNESREYQLLTGACIMVRRHEFLTIGPFDEGYENGWEDDDLCYAYRAAGKRCFYCSKSIVIHHEGRTLKQEKQETKKKLFLHNRTTSCHDDDCQNIGNDIRLNSDNDLHLLGVRERFLRNRSRFFSKWKESLIRDDYVYYRRDGIPFVSIIIPVFNRLDYTRKCLEALFSNTPEGSYELIVIDNGSTDETASFLNESAKTARVLTNSENLGFARACNQGALAAHGEYLMFLNNDTEPQPGWLDALVEVIHQDPVIGAVGSKLLYPDGTIQHAGVAIADDLTTCDPLVGKHIYAGMPSDLAEANRCFCYQALTAASLLVRQSAFVEAGGFDEGYWNGYEDVDLCFTLRKQGHLLVYVPRSVVIHHESKSGPERFTRAGLNIRRLHDKWLSTVTPDVTISQDGSCRETGRGSMSPYLGPGSRPGNRDGKNSLLVSIVILTFNQMECTKDCIDSIRRQTPEPHEIIFVDNGSTDGTREWLREFAGADARYRIIENRENRGFAAGCNQGIAASRGEYVLLLNNDVVVTEGWLSGMMECLHSVPDAGIVGPMTNNISGIQQVPDVKYTDLSGLESYAAEYREMNRHRRIPFRRIVGFCMLFRKTLTAEIGLLDESFGSGNFEDDDLCLRAALAGYRNVIAGDVFIHHVGSASFKGNNIDYSVSISDNGRLFREKWSRPVTDEGEAKQIVTLKTLEKAELFRMKGETGRMIDTILQEGIRANPSESSFYYALAENLLELGRDRDALDTLGELPEGTWDERRHTLTGRALAGLGSVDDALRHAESAARINPRYAAALHLQGVVAAQTGDQARACECWKHAMNADPGFGAPYTSLGLLELEHGNGETGLELLEKGFLLSPLVKDNALHYHTAACAEGQFHRACILISEMHRIYPQHRRIHFLFIDLLIRRGKTSEALEQIESACMLHRADDGMLAAGLELRRAVGPISVPPEKLKAGTGVSLCMIIKNEEDNLPRCLKSLKPVVDEIIIVDTGSTDRSREIAEMFGGRVYDHPWNGDFSAARNVSLDHATGNWVLVMDADEVLSSRDHPEFLRLVSGFRGKRPAYDIVTRNYSTNISQEKWRENDGAYPEEETGAGWTPSNKVRLFPNISGIRFKNPIHEMVDTTIASAGIPIHTAAVAVHHYGNLDDERQKRKGEEYYLLGKKKLEECGDNDFRALCELAVQAGGTGRYEEAVSLWKRVLAIEPSYPLAYFNMGYALMQMGRFEEAKGSSARAMELQPGYFEATVNFAICELCTGMPEMATSVLERVVEERPDHANARLMLALSLLCCDRSDEGTGMLRQLADKGISFIDCLNETARKLAQAGRPRLTASLLEATVACGICNDETIGLARSLEEDRKLA